MNCQIRREILDHSLEVPTAGIIHFSCIDIPYDSVSTSSNLFCVSFWCKCRWSTTIMISMLCQVFGLPEAMHQVSSPPTTITYIIISSFTLLKWYRQYMASIEQQVLAGLWNLILFDKIASGLGCFCIDTKSTPVMEPDMVVMPPAIATSRKACALKSDIKLWRTGIWPYNIYNEAYNHYDMAAGDTRDTRDPIIGRLGGVGGRWGGNGIGIWIKHWLFWQRVAPGPVKMGHLGPAPGELSGLERWRANRWKLRSRCIQLNK